MKRSRFLVVVLAVLALLLVASTASAAPLLLTADVATVGQIISGGTFQSGYPAINAFDDDTGTLLSMNGTSTWFGQDFGDPGYNIGQVNVYRGSSGSYDFSGKLQYSDDGTAWYDTNQTAIVVSRGTLWNQFAVDDYGIHRYWRLLCTTSGYSQTEEVEFLAREETPTETPAATWTGGDISIYVDYPTPVPQYFDPTANSGDGPEPWLLRFYVGVFVVFAFTYVLFRLVDTHQFYLLFMALCMAAAWVTRSVNGAGIVYLFMLIMLLVLKLWGGLQGIFRFGK